ncbi:MAG: hypothetical protein NZ959_05255 [Armatimonadetes bacterium]|nr:hypothetical protein [Armatimonadota bacterium]MDW8122257.1 hypothetical protein [Armatimonadota bacterium]
MASRRKAIGRTVPKLNLIPPHIRALRYTGIAIGGTVVLTALLIAPMLIWWQANASAIGDLDRAIQEMDPKVKEVQQMESNAGSIRSGVQVLADRLSTLDDLHASGKTWSDGLTRITEWIPEGVRLTSLQLTGGQTQATGVLLIGYTTSVRRLAKFYGHLTLCPHLTEVELQEWEWRGVRYPGAQLPPIVPKELKPPTGETVGVLPTPGAGAPGGQMPSVGVGPAAGPGVPPAGGAPAGGAAGGQAPTMAPGGMAGPPGGGQQGGGGSPTIQPGQPAMPGGGGAAMPMMPMMGGAGMGGPGMGMGGPGGFGQQVAIVRDPAAPRTAVYFVIRANLKNPLSVGGKLAAAAAPAAGAGGTGMPMMGAMPMMGGGMPMGGMPGAGGPPGAATAGESGGAGVGGPASGGEEGSGLGGRRAAEEES